MKRPDSRRLRFLLGIAALTQAACGTDTLGDLQPGRDPGADRGSVVASPTPGDDATETAGDDEADLDPAVRGDEALQRLAALEVFEASHIVDPNPAEGPNCYNLPCTEDELASQVERLEALVDVVDAALEEGPLQLSQDTLDAANEGDCSALNDDIESSLDALRALNIVSVSGLSGGDASHCYCFSGGDPCVDAVVEKAGLLSRALANADGAVAPPPGSVTE